MNYINLFIFTQFALSLTIGILVARSARARGMSPYRWSIACTLLPILGLFFLYFRRPLNTLQRSKEALSGSVMLTLFVIAALGSYGSAWLKSSTQTADESSMQLRDQSVKTEYRVTPNSSKLRFVLVRPKHSVMEGDVVLEGDPRIEPIDELSARDIESSVVGFSNGQAEVTLKFNADGAQKFAAITAQNVGRQLLIVVDDKVVSTPVIRERISGGEALISGSLSIGEANSLARQVAGVID